MSLTVNLKNKKIKGEKIMAKQNDTLKINKEIPLFIIGTKYIAMTRIENETTKDQSIVFVRSSPEDFEKSKYSEMRPKDDDLLFGLTFTNKGTVDRFIKLLEEMKNDIKYDEIEDWEQGNK